MSLGRPGWGSPASPREVRANPATACPASWVTGTDRDTGHRPGSPTVGTAIPHCCYRDRSWFSSQRCWLFLRGTFSVAGSQLRGTRDAVRCRATCLAGRTRHGRGKALLGLSWCLCAQICTRQPGALPKPSLQRARSSPSSPASGPEALGEQRGASSGVPRRKAPRRNPEWEQTLSCKSQLTPTHLSLRFCLVL